MKPVNILVYDALKFKFKKTVNLIVSFHTFLYFCFFRRYGHFSFKKKEFLEMNCGTDGGRGLCRKEEGQYFNNTSGLPERHCGGPGLEAQGELTRR